MEFATSAGPTGKTVLVRPDAYIAWATSDQSAESGTTESARPWPGTVPWRRQRSSAAKDSAGSPVQAGRVAPSDPHRQRLSSPWRGNAEDAQ
ncbi:aromatic-ring hydroxylase C-terminal domain-containing protein [Streptomyces adustus]